MLSTLSVLLLLFLLLLSTLTWRQRKCWHLVWELNGWRGVVQQPFFWFLLLVYLEPKSILNVTQQFRKYFQRPLAIVIGSRVLLYVDDPVTMERILNAPECMDKTFMQEGFFARKGLLHARGQKWKIRRKQLNPAFSNSIMLGFFDTFNSVGNQLQQRFAVEMQGDAVNIKDVEDLISRAVLEVSCLTTMGMETNFTKKDSEGIARTYKKLMEISAMKIVKPWLQIDILFRLLDRKNYECSIRSNKLVEKFVSNIVQCKHSEWKEKMHSKKKVYQIVASGGEGAEDVAKATGAAAILDVSAAGADAVDVGHGDGDAVAFTADADVDAASETQNIAIQKRIFIEQIFHLADSGDLKLQDIMDESHSMVLVSFETISNSIIIALLCLAMHTEYQDELRQEINELFPFGNVADISPTQLQQLKYLDMIVNESLRLLTTVPINLRHASRDVKLQLHTSKQRQQQQPQQQHPQLDQHKHANVVVVIPENSIIVLDTFSMQRDTMHWGANAQKFHPQHFAETEKLQRHAYSFAPFSKGIRWCIGWRYSIYLTKILLVKLITAFDFRTATKLEQLQFIEQISLKFKKCENINFDIHEIARTN